MFIFEKNRRVGTVFPCVPIIFQRVPTIIPRAGMVGARAAMILPCVPTKFRV